MCRARPQAQACEGLLRLIVTATLIGGLISYTSIDPIIALFWSALINVIVAVPVMIMLMSSSRCSIGEFGLPLALKAVGWIATIMVALAAAVMFATWNA